MHIRLQNVQKHFSRVFIANRRVKVQIQDAQAHKT